MGNYEQKIVFGVASDEKMKTSAHYNLWEAFTKLLPLKFWLRYYVISLIAYYFLGISSFQINHSYMEYNLFLFPLTMYLFSRMMSRSRVESGTLFNIFSLHTMRSGGVGCVGTFIGLGLKLFVIYILWFFSFVLGLIGIIFFLLDFQRMRR